MTLSPRLLNVANRAPGADPITLCARRQIPSYPGTRKRIRRGAWQAQGFELNLTVRRR
jgi:hypothetical protein